MGAEDIELRSKIYTLVAVDDSTSVLTVLDWIFKEEGYAVHSFNRAAPALTFIQKNRVHLVISDLHMPEMDGLEFVQALRASGWKGIFYFLSGHASELNELNLKELGVTQVIQKPFDLITLTESIQQSLGRSKCP